MFPRERFNTFQGMADLGFGIAGMFIVMVVILILIIGQETNEEDGVKPGSIVAELTWFSKATDVDLWVQDPSGERIGYSKKTSNAALWSLLFDDTGVNTRGTAHKKEVAATKAFVAGEYIVNIHLYALREGDFLPFSTRVRISLLRPNKPTKRLFDLNPAFNFDREEKTVMRFTLNSSGDVVDQSTLRVLVRNVEGDI